MRPFRRFKADVHGPDSNMHGSTGYVHGPEGYVRYSWMNMYRSKTDVYGHVGKSTTTTPLPR